ncbi:MAG TPA: YsnF/AvaK domain-containing protein [Roseiflexaceae bacterium]|nr:YsnF/AvaK domain-containing protein [Roseiflexaceae bacterium]
MKERMPVVVTGDGAIQGRIIAPAQIGAGGQPEVQIELEDGRRLAVPTDSLIQQSDGSYRLLHDLATLERLAEERLVRQRTLDADEATLEVIEETLSVEKRRVETGRVRVQKLVREHEEQIDEPLLREEVEVERVPINQVIDAPVGIRQEGDVTIVPVIEEVLVVEKRLVLKEELRITRREHVERAQQTVTLRREELHVERLSPQDDPGTDIAK